MIPECLHEFLPKRASLNKFMHACYGLSLPRKLWVMGYKGFMGYVGDFPASQLGRWDFLWVMGGYGLREVRRLFSALIRASEPASDGRFELPVTGDAGDSHCMRLLTGLPALRSVQCDASESFT